jgi:hypothetical protein
MMAVRLEELIGPAAVAFEARSETGSAAGFALRFIEQIPGFHDRSDVQRTGECRVRGERFRFLGEQDEDKLRGVRC